jgi:hypothetical protein
LIGLYCPRRTLSFQDVLQFTTAQRREKLNVEPEAFHA